MSDVQVSREMKEVINLALRVHRDIHQAEGHRIRAEQIDRVKRLVEKW